MTEQRLVVLLVEDDASLAEATERALASHGLRVTWTATPLGASNLARKLQPDVVLLDVGLPALSGDALVALLRKSAPRSTRIVLYSSHDDETLRGLARRSGADGWLSKGADGAAVARYVTRLARLSAPTP